MSLATITSKDLARIQKLIERKEALIQQITEINAELATIESGSSDRPRSSTTANGPAPASGTRGAAGLAAPRKRGRGGKAGRGELKERLIRELKAAGNQGVKVKDLADALGTSYGNITAFFQSTAKKIKEIRKVGPAQFAWTGE